MDYNVLACGILILLIAVLVIVIVIIYQASKLMERMSQKKLDEITQKLSEEELCKFIDNTNDPDSTYLYPAVSALGNRGTGKSIPVLLKYYSGKKPGFRPDELAKQIIAISERCHLPIPTNELLHTRTLTFSERIEIYKLIFHSNGEVPYFEELIRIYKEMMGKYYMFDSWKFLAYVYHFGNLSNQEKKLIEGMANEKVGQKSEEVDEGETYIVEYETIREERKKLKTYSYPITGREVLNYVRNNFYKAKMDMDPSSYKHFTEDDIYSDIHNSR